MRDGVLEQVGDPDTVYEKPANTFVAPPERAGRHRDVVYYVGRHDAALAARILHRIG